MEMKQMPYKVTEEVIEHTKYRAKMAIREAAHPIERPSHSIQWRWTGAIAMVAVVMVVVVGTFALVGFIHNQTNNLSTMDRLVAEMSTAPDDVIADISIDAGYYLDEEDNAL